MAVKPNQLWPPNHRFRLVKVYLVTGPTDPAFTYRLDAVTQDEPVGRAPDALRTGRFDQLKLRAERNGHGDGRVYRITVLVYSGPHFKCERTVKVSVPLHPGVPAIDSPHGYYSFF